MALAPLLSPSAWGVVSSVSAFCFTNLVAENDPLCQHSGPRASVPRMSADPPAPAASALDAPPSPTSSSTRLRFRGPRGRKHVFSVPPVRGFSSPVRFYSLSTLSWAKSHQQRFSRGLGCRAHTCSTGRPAVAALMGTQETPVPLCTECWSRGVLRAGLLRSPPEGRRGGREGRKVPPWAPWEEEESVPQDRQHRDVLTSLNSAPGSTGGGRVCPGLPESHRAAEGASEKEGCHPAGKCHLGGTATGAGSRGAIRSHRRGEPR